MMALIGLILVMLGASLGDSENVLVPAVMVGVGLVLIKLATIQVKNKEDEDGR